MQAEVLAAFQVLDRHASREDVLEACRRLFIESDECIHALQRPFDRDEVDAVANAIWEYILDGGLQTCRDIVFKAPRTLEGNCIEVCEYASMFSEAMLTQNSSKRLACLDLGDLRRGLMTFLVGILFRYQFCVSQDRAAFPVSKILEYMDGVRILFAGERREGELSDALWTTLQVLGSLEPRYEDIADIVARLEGRAPKSATDVNLSRQPGLP
jgi:hypothetical protein